MGLGLGRPSSVGTPKKPGSEQVQRPKEPQETLGLCGLQAKNAGIRDANTGFHCFIAWRLTTLATDPVGIYRGSIYHSVGFLTGARSGFRHHPHVAHPGEATSPIGSDLWIRIGRVWLLCLEGSLLALELFFFFSGNQETEGVKL